MMSSLGTNNTAAAFITKEKWQSIVRALQLSSREAEIARLLLDDDTEWTIASRLSISRHTVHTHIERLYRKLGVTSRSQVVMRVFQTYVEISSQA